MWPCGQNMSGMLGAWTFSWSSNSTSVGEPRPEATGRRRFPRHGSPDRRSPGLRHTSEANLLAVAIELLDVVDGATPVRTSLAIQPLLIILSWSFLAILFMLKSASPLQWNAMHQMQLNAVECNLWITNYSTSFCVFRLLQSRFHSGRTLAVRYGCHGASAHWSPRKQPRGLGFWTHGYWCQT